MLSYPRIMDAGSARENTGDLLGLSFDRCTLKIHIYGQSIHVCLVRGNQGRQQSLLCGSV